MSEQLPLFNFVVGAPEADLAAWSAVTSLEDYLQADREGGAQVFASGELCWCLQTYINLRKRHRLPVTCTRALDPDAINIVHSDRLLRLRGHSSTFLVCIQADYPKRGWAHHHLVQNRSQCSATASFLPHWTQAGLVPRDVRRSGVRRVAYAGQISRNLASTVENWRNWLAPHGISFVALPAQSWHDLSAIDVLIGIRSFDRQTHDRKPPTKLLNAWHANVPFLGGCDSAYRQVGLPGEDYLVARTSEEAVEAVLRLGSDEALYAKLVRNGAAKAALYTEAAISEAWEAVLMSDVLPQYRVWRRAGRMDALRHTAALTIGLAYHHCKQTAKHLVRRS